VIEDTFARFVRFTDYSDLPIKKLFMDPHYPLGTVNGRQMACYQYSWDYVDIGSNLGQDGNTRWISEYLHKKYVLQDTDIIVCWDADHAPGDRSWLKVCLKVFDADPRAAYVIPRRDPDWIFNNQEKHPDVGGVRVRKLSWPGGWSMGNFSGSFFRQLPANLNPSHSLYGGSENSFMRAWGALGLTGYMLEDYWDDMTNVGFDGAYIAWKLEVITKKGAQVSFEDWLKDHPVDGFAGTVRKESV
jgi:hypothetical protein